MTNDKKPEPGPEEEYRSLVLKRRVASAHRKNCEAGWQSLLSFWSAIDEPPCPPSDLSGALAILSDWVDKSSPPPVEEAPDVLRHMVMALDDPRGSALILQMIGLATSEGCCRGLERLLISEELNARWNADDDPDTSSLPPPPAA